MSELDAQQGAIARLCLGAEVDAGDLAALGGDARRWLLYRELARQRLWSAIVEALPRTRAAAGDERFAAWFARYLAQAPPTSRYVREVAPAFARWVRAAEGDGLAAPSPWLPDALALDVAEHAVGLSDARVDPEAVTAFAMDLPAAFDPTHRRLRLRWALDGDSRVVERPRALLLHRHPTRHSVETLELTPLAAAVIDALDDRATAATDAVRAVLARHDVVAGEVFVESFAGLLAELMERGVLAGSWRGLHV